MPDKTKLTEGVTRSLKPVKSWTIPAKNGDYRIADYFPEAPGEHIQDIDCRGTLVSQQDSWQGLTDKKKISSWKHGAIFFVLSLLCLQ
ncbi:hypothetical protein [Varibaculum cambriense]|uniref:hypothetical protein n=1 Tax=Varibaculum cambriense TaxID=184870 RepID=UPI00242C8ACB|nr:hypothetical protein [Varibaculum cambriense]